MANANQNGILGLRAIATLFIVLFHFELSYPFISNGRIFGTSYLFVEFFFILSGFLFAKGIIDGRHKTDSFTKVIKDKLIRLYPAYLATLLLMPTVYSLAFYQGNWFEWFVDDHMWDFIVDLFMLQSLGLSNFEYVNGPAWYVSALFFATLLAFVYIKYVKNKYGTAIIAIGLYLCIWYFESPSMSSSSFMLGYVPVPLVRGLAGTFLGVFCYFIYREYREGIDGFSLLTISVLEFLVLALIMDLVLFKETGWLNIIILPFSVLIIMMFSSQKGLISQLLSHKCWIFFSNISYSFYLSQSFCSNCFTCILTNVPMPYVLIWDLILNLIVAVVIYYFVEKPSLAFVH